MNNFEIMGAMVIAGSKDNNWIKNTLNGCWYYRYAK
jgi:hypothetical protein